MTRNSTLAWRLGIAGLSLLIAVAVYCFARFFPPEILAPFHVFNADLAIHTGIFGSAPSFFYTLALGLFISACTSTLNGARLHCMVWIGLALCLELSQIPKIAEPVAIWLNEVLPESIWEIVGSYWTHGVFDKFDLLATAIGGSVVIVILTYLLADQCDES